MVSGLTLKKLYQWIKKIMDEIFNNLMMCGAIAFTTFNLFSTPVIQSSIALSSPQLGITAPIKAPEETAKLVAEAGITDKKFAWAIHHILVPEGGWSNHPNDRGGATKYGIIESVAKRHGLNVANISKVDAIKIYYSDYWLASGADKAESPLDLAILNSYVNSGRRWDIGGSTPLEQAENYLQQQDNYYTQIYTSNPSKTVFKSGWHRRTEYMRKAIKGEFPSW
jgi:hypothetical protein